MRKLSERLKAIEKYFALCIMEIQGGDLMRCKTIIDKNHEEEVLIYVHEKSKWSCDIEDYISSISNELIGYTDKSAELINVNDVFCFTIEDGKIYALTKEGKYKLKQRLYVLEEMLNGDFVKINQSCIVNTRKIQRFDVSLSGAMSVVLKNGYRDYISRRQLKNVKERIGI